VQPEGEIEESSQISVIVATCDPPAVVRRCLASLERYAAKAEVIFVDDGSPLPETNAVLKDFQLRNGWKLVRHQNPLTLVDAIPLLRGERGRPRHRPDCVLRQVGAMRPRTVAHKRAADGACTFRVAHGLCASRTQTS
jgi:glycosyl transferase family 2